MKIKAFHTLAFAAAATFGMVWNGNLAPVSFSDMMSRADAIIGRPATPMSYAGVARRTTARVGYDAAAVGVGVAAGLAVGAAASTGCVTTYNAYGQPVTACN